MQIVDDTNIGELNQEHHKNNKCGGNKNTGCTDDKFSDKILDKSHNKNVKTESSGTKEEQGLDSASIMMKEKANYFPNQIFKFISYTRSQLIYLCLFLVQNRNLSIHLALIICSVFLNILVSKKIPKTIADDFFSSSFFEIGIGFMFKLFVKINRTKSIKNTIVNVFVNNPEIIRHCAITSVLIYLSKFLLYQIGFMFHPVFLYSMSITNFPSLFSILKEFSRNIAKNLAKVISSWNKQRMIAHNTCEFLNNYNSSGYVYFDEEPQYSALDSETPDSIKSNNKKEFQIRTDLSLTNINVNISDSYNGDKETEAEQCNANSSTKSYVLFEEIFDTINIDNSSSNLPIRNFKNIVLNMASVVTQKANQKIWDIFIKNSLNWTKTIEFSLFLIFFVFSMNKNSIFFSFLAFTTSILVIHQRNINLDKNDDVFNKFYSFDTIQIDFLLLVIAFIFYFFNFQTFEVLSLRVIVQKALANASSTTVKYALINISSLYGDEIFRYANLFTSIIVLTAMLCKQNGSILLFICSLSLCLLSFREKYYNKPHMY